jgi:hypothetical protein
MHHVTTKLFRAGLDTLSIKGISMDKKTRTQVSLVLLIIGLIMLFIPYLKYFDSIVPGISQSFNLMFYLGLVLIVIGYYLK